MNSGPDRQRTRASEIKLDKVADDEVSVPKKDATDWKYVVVEQPGLLVAELHWDDDNARLGLALYDDIGAQIATGKDWKQKGRRVELAQAKKGRYFIRVFVEGDGGSNYSLRMRMKPNNKLGPRVAGACHKCAVGDRICLGNDGFAICQQTPNWCNAWGTIEACPKGKSCQNGACVDGCADQCKAERRRCASKAGYQVCRKIGGCLQWSEATPCGKRRRCHAGHCGKFRTGKPDVVVKQPKQPKTHKPAVTSNLGAGNLGVGKIISIYRYRGRMTLHIEIGTEAGVTPGMTGTVLAGETSSPLADGAIKVTKVSGRYCIATTDLKKLGKNRRVRINIR